MLELLLLLRFLKNLFNIGLVAFDYHYFCAPVFWWLGVLLFLIRVIKVEAIDFGSSINQFFAI